MTNLWPERAPGYHTKDRLENVLRGDVCAGRLDLATARQAIATDWAVAYRQYLSDSTNDR